MTSLPTRTGVWLIGAHGNVSTTAIVGARALARELVDSTGMVTHTPEFEHLSLISPQTFVFGGHDRLTGSLHERALEMARAGIFGSHLCPPLRTDLENIASRIRPAPIGSDATGTASQAALRVTRDIETFRQSHQLEQVIVVYLASTEPPLDPHPALASLEEFRTWLDKSPAHLISSGLLYALGALDAGCPYINFTPNPGPEVPALDQLARRKQIPYAGKDGKTGETLLKTCLAPLFLARNLKVLSWEGTNLLGGGDGATLADPETRKTKTGSKDRALRTILQDPEVHSGVHIHHVPSLSDWKTAWDFIHFEGFLGTRMSLQFTWQGCDSALAAPLVLDLVRLVDLAHREGQAGPLEYLAPFFKDPVGSPYHDFPRQMQALLQAVGSPKEISRRT